MSSKVSSMDGEPEQFKPAHNVFGRILKLNHHRCAFIFAIIFSLLGGCLPLILNVLLGDMVTIFSQANYIGEVRKTIYKMLAFAIGFLLCMFLFHLCGSFSNPAFINDIRQTLFKSMMAADIEFFDETQTGTLMGRLTHDVALITEIYITKFLTSLQSFAQAIAGIIFGICISWRVTLSIIVVYPLSALIFYGCEKLIDKLWMDYHRSSTNASEKATEVIASFRTVKAFDQEAYETDQFYNSLNLMIAVYNRTSIIAGLKDGSIELLLNAVVMIIWYFSCWILENRPNWGMQTGDLMVLQMSLLFAVNGLSQVLTLADDFKKAAVSAEAILSITDSTPKIQQIPEENDQNAAGRVIGENGKVRGKIEFRDVCFKYKTMEKYAINHLSFTIQPGETVAFVGESGCGKSTTLQLLQRFYDIESGQILIDDVDIRTLSPIFLRQQISIVPQSPVLYSMTIRDNIAYAAPQSSDSEIAEAARVGNAHNFVMELPENYQTVVGPISLSGGQKQRICISRAIVPNSPILLLDEATAALDTESEQLVQQSIEQVRQGKTAIMVAHRLATVINADRILVFKEGQIAETGTHQQLVELNGIYSNLVKYQLQ